MDLDLGQIRVSLPVMSPTLLRNVDTVEIVNIHQDDMEFSLVDEIYKSLDPPKGKPRSFPTLLLYDTKGLKLFEDITYLDEYYLTNTEIEILTKHAKRIVARIPENAQLVELGSGNLRKVEILLRECERVEKKVDYYALDLSLGELKRTFSEISPESFTHVGFHGLHGTYDDGLDWLKIPENRKRPTVVLSIGSSMGNFSPPGAAEFLGNFSKQLNPSDFMLIGLDACKNPEKVFNAYNDAKGVTRQFYENGLLHANRVLGFQAFKAGEWEVLTTYDPRGGRHQAFYAPKVDVVINGIKIAKGEKLVCEEAWKYGRKERDELWRKANLISEVEFGNSTEDYYLHLLSPAALHISMNPSKYAAQPIPSIGNFQSLWIAWDLATRTMVPREELLSKPIKLRKALIFYIGHIPTFFDTHLTRALQEKSVQPSHYKRIFERGIDPDVEDPSQCHVHSETPDEWPPLDEILDYQEKVRTRALTILQEGYASQDRAVGEALWIGYEHEAMHLETFLYMLIQSDKTLPPTGVDRPNFEQISLQAKRNETPNKWFTIPQQTIEIGLDDSDDEVVPSKSFGWDNEKPQRKATVHAFEAQARPITNGEYAKYIQDNGIQTYPASWVFNQGQDNPISKGVGSSGAQAGSSSSPAGFSLEDVTVRTVFGPVALKFAQDWPLVASYDEVASYAKYMKCRIPTFEETRSIYHYADQLKADRVTNGHGNGVNGLDNGSKPHSTDQTIFRDLTGCNVGFQNWHPVPVTPNGDRLAGQSEMGGVWEWTSTPLKPHDGFKSMDIYPGYTADFFDGKHNIVLGGSWATLPRIAGRTTFVNWYQHNYRYTWAGARLVRDL
ncbi:hypothetical protein DTO013E5_266 [Penicillium roqueforti]|nr:uncharacterized protein LCP9604111_872 [Penicillium roqueforti]KAF9253346.1 hypothetical protein LCP9604111_872 [Penicillium roqueforti]KAI1838862.1 hypothetical protein CBS147337_587 [Penicillium roqueforti]KAI2680259.1 hypothetical protein CBS147355_3239 [Penicillium roqueforti]KAI2691352.1 hypothetical protein LCP963914a_1553 [Penicillium roqueforti]KAI2706644.1 hypothetical protein CBS147372_555 [Penicillium roqueforti]